MSQASQLAPKLARGVYHAARALAAAVRKETIYRPASSNALLRDAPLRTIFTIGSTRATLLVDGVPAGSEAETTETGALPRHRKLVEARRRERLGSGVKSTADTAELPDPMEIGWLAPLRRRLSTNGTFSARAAWSAANRSMSSSAAGARQPARALDALRLEPIGFDR